MKIIHTSDWHLGQHFMGKTRQAEHQAFLSWLVATALEHDVDAILVAGDIFDTGSPPSYARELYNHFIVSLQKTATKLILLGGNHDSVATLSESKSLLAELNTTVIAGVSDELAEQVLVLKQKDGTPGAIICAIPFIRPRDVQQSLAGQSAEEKQLSLQDGIFKHYQALYQLALAKRAEYPQAQLPIVATGHLTTVGASASESVREIYVGALEAFPTSAFPPADYIALGHIHRPQKVGGLEHIRYCGSPIPLSFDEAKQTKEVLLITLNHGGLQAVTPLPVPRFQELLSLRGNLAELEVAISQITAEQNVWLEVLVSQDDYLSDLPSRIQAMIGDKSIEVLRIRKERNTAASWQPGHTETLAELSPADVFSQRIAGEELEPSLQKQLEGLYTEIVLGLQEAKP
ncbi:exonuclease subunit SbcD [Iodobacter sp. CM08]|uniref:exonuclease subunit SbcD n=1 Tax=Iodobacter sp. CM08 TaxID=3085902 RepID=UPI002980FDBE|nr:exonuclease subunit SbcD [Iodobacter sp. CM08]MDW5415221.1 exonuclease subunit SbcD [Iodobacter sp. CM08]